jgi:serine/threonine protein kinase
MQPLLSPLELLPPAPPAPLSVRVSLAFEPESEAPTASPASATSSPSTLLRKKRALSPPPVTDASDNNTNDGHSQTNQEKLDDHGIDPHDLMLLKVIGRGTFAQQVALAKHTRTQSMYVVKTLDKRNLVRRKQVAHTLAEKSVLEALGGDHPFIVKLYAAFQTERDLNFVLEYCQGGELFYHLQQQQQQKFDERATRFYAAEVLAALCELHSKGIVYRDLKPENVLLDALGHVKLADFGFAKQDMAPGARTYSFCGSPEYLSPEMVTKDGHGIETDMWSFGCFCYELLTGAPPFQQGSSLARLFAQIQRGTVWYPSDLSGPALSLLEGLLCVDPTHRLTAAQAMAHPFFQPLDWTDVLERHVPPPIVPVCDGCDCTQNFDDGFTNEPVVSLKLGDDTVIRSSGDQQPKRLRPDAESACGFYASDPLAAFQDF